MAIESNWKHEWDKKPVLISRRVVLDPEDLYTITISGHIENGQMYGASITRREIEDLDHAGFDGFKELVYAAVQETRARNNEERATVYIKIVDPTVE